jgi:hypothetical protein
MKTIYNIGIKNIKERQITFIIISLILLSINLFFLWIDKSVSALILTIIVFCLLFIVNFLGSYICKVFLLDNIINIENLFRNNKYISVSEFAKVTVIFPYASVYRIHFKNGQKFYFAINSKEAFKTIFSINHNDYALKLTEEIKKKL